jgi:hypothetical protein
MGARGEYRFIKYRLYYLKKRENFRCLLLHWQKDFFFNIYDVFCMGEKYIYDDFTRGKKRSITYYC